MTANLVFVRMLDNRPQLCAENAPGAHALIGYRKIDETDVPWHTHGKGLATWTWDDLRRHLYVDEIEVRSSDSYSRVLDDDGSESFVRVPGEQHLRLHLGGSSHHVGTLGQSYALLSRREFFSQAKPLIEAGYALDTAGDLAGGSRSWLQVDLGHDAMVEIRKDDAVRASALFANSYDGSLAYTAGMVGTRVVCSNTIARAFAELRTTGAVSLKAKHSGNIQGKVLDIQGMMIQHLAAFREKVDVFKRLDAVKVRGQLDLLNYAAFLSSDASDAKIAASIDNVPRVSARSANALENAWMVGPGSKRETYWDLYNAATFDLSHSLGNEKQGESASTRAGRRLDSLLFGASGDKLDSALRIATTMASLRAA